MGNQKRLYTKYILPPDAIEAHKELSKSVREKNEALWKEQASKDPSSTGWSSVRRIRQTRKRGRRISVPTSTKTTIRLQVRLLQTGSL